MLSSTIPGNLNPPPHTALTMRAENIHTHGGSLKGVNPKENEVKRFRPGSGCGALATQL
jgi:hypothetical protein